MRASGWMGVSGIGSAPSVAGGTHADGARRPAPIRESPMVGMGGGNDPADGRSRLGRKRRFLPVGRMRPTPPLLSASRHSPRARCQLGKIDEGTGENTFSPVFAFSPAARCARSPACAATLAYQASSFGCPGTPGLVGVAEIQVAEGASDGDLADCGQRAEAAGLRLQHVQRAGDLGLLCRDVVAPAVIQRQRQLAPARLGGVEDAVAEGLLPLRGPARRARRRETAAGRCRCCRGIRR